ncbi:hypothetical protein B9479_001252 [Cryptococcus floricola]|uniref:HTH CENPB-type domain-containing protein n=1 Tax=Cryptococcus floricola TaxID=2591691 RepID=A0A5D3B767_9TREE|nr:hypothetical protein B9479_001252 [Cryptococcus floricola]
MADPIDFAVAEKHEHPDKSYQRVVADEFHVPRTTLRSRHSGAHFSLASSAPRHLSEAQEMQLVDKINMFAGRGTLLSTQNVKEYAETICGHSLGRNWVSTFVTRHRRTLVSRYWKYQDKGRFDAASIESLESFFKLLELLIASIRRHPIET